MLEASCKVGKGAAGMRQDELQVGILVERSGINEFARQEGVFDGSVDPSGERGWPGRPAAAESVDRAIQLMKDDRVIQFLNARKNWRKVCIEYVIAPFDRIRQVDGPHAGRTSNAVQLLQGELGVANRQLDADDKAVGIFLVDLNASVIDDLREMRAILGGSSLPRHCAGKGQAMH